MIRNSRKCNRLATADLLWGLLWDLSPGLALAAGIGHEDDMEKAAPLLTRRIAIELVEAVVDHSRPFDIALAEDIRITNLEPRDRAFTRRLVATVLRRLGQIDALIDHCLERPLPRKAGAVRSILRIGVCQVFFMDVADHAAVDTAVELTRDVKLHGFSKLVNGVLRRLLRDGAALLAAQDAPRLNTPAWMWESWEAAYGAETCRKIALAHEAEAPLDISLKGDSAVWAEKLEAVILANGTLRRQPGGAVQDLPGFSEGAWWIQDAAARSVTGLLGDVAGKRVIDLCAAPGGKTLYLAAAGAQVTAVDRSDKRLRRLRENLDRLNLSADVVTADATAWAPPAPADAVLLDAPCSATGTIRRHPDILWNKRLADVDSLAKTQARLLNAAIPMVKPGGLLVFATCSLQPEEGERQIEALLAGRNDVRLDPIQAGELPGFEAMVDGDGMFRSLPSYGPKDSGVPGGINGGMDGFFAGRLRRSS